MGNWTERDISDQSGKTFVITGGNSGIGWEAGRMLAEHGAHVILACRNADKAKDAVAAIEKTAAKGAKVEAMSLDLASLSSVERFAGELAGKIERLDALLNNAGLMALPYGKTADGFETQLGVNHLGHFALTGRLLPLLRKTPGARVVSVSSQAHRMGKMNWDDLMSERRYEKWTAYGQSKLANLLFTFELGRRLKKAGDGIVVTAAHPGYSATNLQHKGPEMEGSKLQGMFMSMGNGIMAQTAAKGALPTLRAALDPAAVSGDYFGPSGIFEIAGYPVKVGTSARARDEASGKQLWERSVALTHVDYAGL
jgi:NAD(P)-dependent dehydrogenase (short-subunit alcohol dehydrogenase family)